MVAEETKKNFAAYERDDLKLREVSRLLATGLVVCKSFNPTRK